MIKISKGLDLPISGKPSMLITDEPKISSVSLLGNDFVGMKPTMLVKENETVKAGQKLFEDKKNIGVFFTAPAGGIVKSINRGDKRKFLSIEIEISNKEDFIEFNIGSSAEEIKNTLVESGLWNCFKTRPFIRTPNISTIPEALFINCCDTNPLSVDPWEIINQDKDYFDEGISLLKTLFDCDIHITYQNNKFDRSHKGINYHQFVGPHPAGLVGTHISKIHPVNINSNVWTLGFQDIISMGYLKINKKIRTHKIISIGGPAVFEPSLLKVRYGSNIDEITAGKIEDNARVISGSVLHGHESEGVMNYLGFYD